MALTKLFQRYTFTDAHLNAVLQDYRRKTNEVINYFLDTDFGSLALYDTDKSDVLNLKWNEDDSNPRDLNFKVNKANRTINLSANLTVEGASLINSDLTTDANWATSGSITATSFIIGGNTLNTTEWAFLDGQNQAVKTTDAPGFATGVTIGKLTLADGSITESDGAISFGNENLDTSGYIALKSNAELRFYDNGNYVGFEAPALGADCIWVLPTADGAAGEHMVSDGSKNLSWTTGAGTGDVSAAVNFGADNVMLRSDGVAKGCQHSGITVDNSNNLSGAGTLACGTLTVTQATTSTFKRAGNDAILDIITFDTTPSDRSQLRLRTSDSNTIDTLSETQDGDLLGEIGFFGVDDASSWQEGAKITAVQDGAAGTGEVPTKLIFETYSDTAKNTDQLVLKKGGSISISKNLDLTSATSTITGGTLLNIEAGGSGIESHTIRDDTTGTAANVYITAVGGNFRRSTSAKKYKDEIKNLELDSSLIYNLRPVSWTSKCEFDNKKQRFHGLVADEIEQIYPDIIIYNKNNEAESYDNQMLITLLLAEIQNIRQELDELKNK